MPKVGLNMIVKNEAAIIERCLASVAPHVDAYVIADTGSTDDTPAIIERVMREANVPGEIVHVPFEDFSQARNAALDAARASKESFDYLFFIDADMTLLADDAAWRDALDAHAYFVTQQGYLALDNVRLVKRAHPCRYKYPTHEVLQVGREAATLDSISFVDHADGSSRPEKQERDLRLLLQELEKNPNDARCAFYVAQTYTDMGRWEDARQWFLRRLGMRGYEEERWYSAYRLAFIAMRVGDEREFFYRVLDATRMRPDRAEPLHLLVSYLRLRKPGDARLAALLAYGAAELPFPTSDRLFVEPDVYDYKLLHELSIVGGYSGAPSIRHAAREACCALAVDATVPAKVRDNARENLVHYAGSAGDAFGARVVPLLIEKQGGYAPMNPSVVRAPDGRLLCNVRFVNYTREQAKSGRWPPVVDTRNVVLELDPETLAERSRATLADLSGRQTYPSRVLGFEDVRLFFDDTTLRGIATVRDAASDTTNRMIVFHVKSPVTEGEPFLAHRARLLDGPDPKRPQKNWVPLAHGHLLKPVRLFVYGADPTTVLSEEGGGETYGAVDHPGTLALDHLRGGSQAIPFHEREDDEHSEQGDAHGYLYVTHEVVAKRGAKPGSSDRTYLHRLVWMDSDLRIKRVSDAFYFEKRGVEFCAGLARVGEGGENLVFSFGVDDERAMLAVASARDVRAFLLAGFMAENDEGEGDEGGGA